MKIRMEKRTVITKQEFVFYTVIGLAFTLFFIFIWTRFLNVMQPILNDKYAYLFLTIIAGYGTIKFMLWVIDALPIARGRMTFKK